jgi:hypothetical protein
MTGEGRQNLFDSILGPKANAQNPTSSDTNTLRSSPGQGNNIFWGNESVNVDPLSRKVYETSRGGLNWLDSMIKSPSIKDKIIAASPVGMYVGASSMLGEMLGGGAMGIEATIQNPRGTEKAIVSGWDGNIINEDDSTRNLGITGGEVAMTTVDLGLTAGQLGIGAAERYAMGRGNVLNNRVLNKVRADDIAEQIKMDNIRSEVSKTPLKHANAETVDQLIVESSDMYGTTDDIVTSGLRGNAQTKYITSKHQPDFWEVRGKSYIKGEPGDVEAYGVGKNVLYGKINPESVNTLKFNTEDVPNANVDLDKFSTNPAGFVRDDKMFGHMKSTNPIKKYATNKLLNSGGKSTRPKMITRSIRPRSQLDDTLYNGPKSRSRMFSTSDELDAMTKTGVKTGVASYNVGVGSAASINMLFKNRQKHGVKNLSNQDRGFISNFEQMTEGTLGQSNKNILNLSTGTSTKQKQEQTQRQTQRTANVFKMTEITPRVVKPRGGVTPMTPPVIPSFKLPGSYDHSTSARRRSISSGLKWFNPVDSWLDDQIAGTRKPRARRRRR